MLLPSFQNQSSSLGPIMSSKAMSIKGVVAPYFFGPGP
jgi:hypothetical protein